jgi:hypothetical protein
MKKNQAQPNKTNLLDLMTDADRAKVNKRVLKEDSIKSDGITKEWFKLAELGFYFGWEAIQAVLDDVITLNQANLLIDGAIKIHNTHIYDMATATLAGSSSQAGAFNKLMKPYKDSMKDVN